MTTKRLIIVALIFGFLQAIVLQGSGLQYGFASFLPTLLLVAVLLFDLIILKK